jgi:hypothetical protein
MENLKETDCSEELDVDVIIIVKRIKVIRYGRGTGFIWLRIATSVRIL